LPGERANALAANVCGVLTAVCGLVRFARNRRHERAQAPKRAFA
jgi:hypothetical protein